MGRMCTLENCLCDLICPWEQRTTFTVPISEQAPLLSATEEALSRQHLCSWPANLSKSILTSSVALLWTLFSTMTP